MRLSFTVPLQGNKMQVLPSFLMQQRSSDRPQGERLESSRDISWTREIRFYLSMAVLAQILYLGGSVGLVKYHEWIRSCTAPASPTPQSASSHLQQQQIIMARVKQQTQQQLIQAMTQTAQMHPEKKTREQAILFLQQNGVEFSPPPVFIAQGKG